MFHIILHNDVVSQAPIHLVIPRVAIRYLDKTFAGEDGTNYGPRETTFLMIAINKGTACTSA